MHLLHTNGGHRIPAPDAATLFMDHYLCRSVSGMTTDPCPINRKKMLSYFGMDNADEAEKWYQEVCTDTPLDAKHQTPEDEGTTNSLEP